MATGNTFSAIDLNRAEKLSVQHLALCPLITTFIKAVEVQLNTGEITLINNEKKYGGLDDPLATDGLEDALAKAEESISNYCIKCPLNEIHKPQPQAIAVANKPWESILSYSPAINIQTK
jgi:hypothetical protein